MFPNFLLFKTLHDKQAEVQLLCLDVDHYKQKLQRAIKCECSCRSKVLEDKEVQVNCDTDLTNLHKYCINVLPVKYQTAKREIEKLKQDEAVKVKNFLYCLSVSLFEIISKFVKKM